VLIAFITSLDANALQKILVVNASYLLVLVELIGFGAGMIILGIIAMFVQEVC